MKIKLYRDIEVHLLSKTENPLEVIQVVLDLPMGKVICKSREELLQRLMRPISADHGTVLEFLDFTFLIKGISGAGLRQIRTHRTCSHIASSQHFQDAVKFGLTFEKVPRKKVLDAIETLYSCYEEDKKEIGKEEARMYLPVATTYNLVTKVNGRNLVHFLQTRLCRRNCKEVRVVALKMYEKLLEYLPEVFKEICCPQCCKEGNLSCGELFDYSTDVERLLK